MDLFKKCVDIANRQLDERRRQEAIREEKAEAAQLRRERETAEERERVLSKLKL